MDGKRATTIHQAGTVTRAAQRVTLEAVTERLSGLTYAELERVIDRGLGTFYEVGAALARIRDERLYRESHDNFDAYCRERFGIDRVRAHRLIGAAAAYRDIEAHTGQMASAGEPLTPPPQREAHAVELAAVRPEHRARVWQKVVETAPRGRITANHIADVVALQPPNVRRQHSGSRSSRLPAVDASSPDAPPRTGPVDRMPEWMVDFELEVESLEGASPLTVADAIIRWRRAIVRISQVIREMRRHDSAPQPVGTHAP